MATGQITIQNPDKLNATLVVTMPISKWKEAREELGTTAYSGGGRIISNLIDDLVGQVVNSQFYAREKDEKDEEKEESV